MGKLRNQVDDDGEIFEEQRKRLDIELIEARTEGKLMIWAAIIGALIGAIATIIAAIIASANG